MKIDIDEMMEIEGGALTITATLLNAVSRLISTVLEWGRMIGSSLYRYTSRNYCR